MVLQSDPVVSTQMLIRRPVEAVFEAFVDPHITTRFWFTGSSGKLEEGRSVSWEWEMYGITVPVKVRELELNRKILIEWDDPPSEVEWTFDSREDESTLITIDCSGFSGREDEVVAKAIDSMGGFSLVLAGLKALLEHDVELNLVADRHPDAHR